MARHHQSKRSEKLEKHESHHGMPYRRSHKKMMGNNGSYEYESAMIHEDRGAPCLLPTNVIQKEYPSAPRVAMSMVGDDLYQGAERQLKEDENDLRMLKSPRRW